ncbi:MAG: kynureninase [Cytophagales bacterium]|nr:kynureninase [Cytophagales bacterium]
MRFENSLSFARSLDKQDPLRKFQSQFHIPKIKGKKSLYLCGNSLGLQPRNVKSYLLEELHDWATLGVEGHIHGKRPWLYYHHLTKKSLAKLVGAKPSEVVAMNQLTVNLHLMLTTFYRPTSSRFKILAEAGAFSSDQYALESQIKLHNLDPQRSLVELSPRPGEFALRTEDILAAIEKHGDELALVLFGAVQYYSGQFFDVSSISAAARKVGANVGFDLAHAIGNVPLSLHKDGVDFAVWCSYKYLNSGPGSVAGAFVHDRHAENFELPRMAGWWGHREANRFEMKKGFQAMDGVDGWQISNFPVLTGAAHLAALSQFDGAGIKPLRTKSLKLTGYLHYLLRLIDATGKQFTIITPEDPASRGCQLSLLMKQKGRAVFQAISRKGVIADWREPNVIRIAPVPLYNSFEDVYRFTEIFARALC